MNGNKVAGIGRTYYLCFNDGNHFFRRFLKKGYGHVYILYKDDISWWCFNPARHVFEWGILGPKPSEPLHINMYKKAHQTVVAVTCKAEDKWDRVSNPFWMVNCVNMVKYFTGIHAWCFTPYGFYKRLKKMHSREKYSRGISKIEFILERRNKKCMKQKK